MVEIWLLGRVLAIGSIFGRDLAFGLIFVENWVLGRFLAFGSIFGILLAFDSIFVF